MCIKPTLSLRVNYRVYSDNLTDYFTKIKYNQNFFYSNYGQKNHPYLNQEYNAILYNRDKQANRHSITSVNDLYKTGAGFKITKSFKNLFFFTKLASIRVPFHKNLFYEKPNRFILYTIFNSFGQGRVGAFRFYAKRRGREHFNFFKKNKINKFLFVGNLKKNIYNKNKYFKHATKTFYHPNPLPVEFSPPNKAIIKTPFVHFYINKITIAARIITNKLRCRTSNSSVVSKKTFELSYFRTRYSTHFILTSLGLTLPLKFFYKSRLKYIYILKKKVYSFLKINELKMHIFSSRRKLFLYKVVRQKSRNSLLNYSLLESSRLFFGYFFSKSTKYSPTFYADKIYKKNNNLKSDLSADELSDLRIPRVKFKPGYQRMWRHYRSALGNSIDYKYTYQKQLTKYIKTFSRKLHQTYMLQNENLAYKLFIYTRLVLDKATFDIFLKNKLLFVNNSALSSRNLYLYSGDLLQVEITNWYYIFNKWLINCIKKRSNRLNKLIYRKSLPARYKLLKQRKQKKLLYARLNCNYQV
jgi:hypothetical protein